MALWVKQPIGGNCCQCPERTEPCKCGKTPCSVFEPDNTDFGSLTVAAANSSAVSNNLPPGLYTFVFTDGTFQFLEADGIVLDDSWWNQGLAWRLSNGRSGVFPLVSHSFTNSHGGSQAGYASAGESITASRNSTPERFANLDFGVLSASIIQTRLFVPGGSATYRVVRTQKPIADFPKTLRIRNFAPLDRFRWKVTYEGNSTPELELDITAGEFQSALNALASITADGGVATTGNAEDGFVVTWNNDGLRTALETSVVTVSPGMVAKCVVNQAGVDPVPGPGVAAEQVVTVKTICDLCFEASAGAPEWDGALRFVNLGCQMWQSHTIVTCSLLPPSGAGTYVEQSLNGFQFLAARVYLSFDQAMGCPWVLVIFCRASFLGSPSFTPVWMGMKRSGKTPDGTYHWANSVDIPYTQLCPVDQTGGVQQITLDPPG